MNIKHDIHGIHHTFLYKSIQKITDKCQHLRRILQFTKFKF